jgi:drug/metabolite transporter (DMT)-like permease
VTLRDTLLCAGFSLVLPIGQAMFKSAALYNERLSGPIVLRLLTNWPLIGALVWYAFSALFWFYILTRVPLARAYVFAVVGSGLVPLIAWLVFKEPLGWRFAVGYGLMIAGFLVIMQGEGVGRAASAAARNAS